MAKAYKILLFTCFITITGFTCRAQSLLAYGEPGVKLLMKHVPAQPDTQKSTLSSSTVNFTHATYKITQETKKINTTLVQKDAVLLLHLTSPNNQIYVQASDAIGQKVLSAHYPAMEAGFYEIPVLPTTSRTQLYSISLVVNRETYSFQISPTP
ncbi:MAG: hypothetical protein RIG62_08355 [Cyclobacteriaceae bacterium]